LLSTYDQLCDKLSREHKVLDTFKQDLDRTFDQLTAIENTYKTRSAR
jgi:hypothetical protein